MVVIFELEAKPKIFTVGDGARIVDWIFEGCADERVRKLVEDAVKLVVEAPRERP